MNNEISQIYHLLLCDAVPAGDGGFRPGCGLREGEIVSERTNSIMVYAVGKGHKVI